MLTTRRALLAAGASAVTLSAMPGRAIADTAGPDAAAQALLADMAEAMLADAPETASGLGIDTGERAALKSRLGNKTPAGQAQIAAHVKDRLAQLRAIDLEPLSPATRIDVEVVRTAHETADRGFAFPFGDMAIMNSNWSYRNSPYAVAQNTGSFVETPDFLDSNHSIRNSADADAYMARLDAYAANLAGETQRLKQDAGIGVVAPAFLLDKTLGQMRAVQALPFDQWVPAASIARRTKDMPGHYGAKAEAFVRDRIAPALAAQVAELERHRATATMDAGAWKLPQGDAYYAWALSAGTTTTMAPEEVHKLGLAQLAALQSQMDGLLKKLGMTKGTVGERMTAMGKDPRNLFPDSDAGRQQILQFIEGRLADIRTRLPNAFATLVPA
ncbi:DUF885 family protein, partial [Sphingobium sp.]|uniref:DUF885 family protein n=1 Tax=Sphingobium sp. TaxID=1912891 RepID=UPI003B3A728A